MKAFNFDAELRQVFRRNGHTKCEYCGEELLGSWAAYAGINNITDYVMPDRAVEAEAAHSGQSLFVDGFESGSVTTWSGALDATDT